MLERYQSIFWGSYGIRTDLEIKSLRVSGQEEESRRSGNKKKT